MLFLDREHWIFIPTQRHFKQTQSTFCCYAYNEDYACENIHFSGLTLDIAYYDHFLSTESFRRSEKPRQQ